VEDREQPDTGRVAAAGGNAAVSEIIFDDLAPTTGRVRFQGDLLHAPGHGSLEQGFLEFYPRTYGRLAMNAMLLWASQGSGHTAVWPPEDDPLNFPPAGKVFEVWHNDVFMFPETNDTTIPFFPDPPAERFATGSMFSYNAMRRRITSGGGTTQQAINQQAVVWYDLRNLPPGTVTRAELVGFWLRVGPSTPFHLDWITGFDRGPLGYRIWMGDYGHGNGGAFSGESERLDTLQEDRIFRGVLPLQGITPIRQRPLLGLRLSFPVSPVPVLDSAQVDVQCFMNWSEWNFWWGEFAESGDSDDAEFAVSALPCLRVFFDAAIDEPVHRHNARNVRAARGSPRNLGRMSG
jgi:hypothetical protein